MAAPVAAAAAAKGGSAAGAGAGAAKGGGSAAGGGAAKAGGGGGGGGDGRAVRQLVSRGGGQSQQKQKKAAKVAMVVVATTSLLPMFLCTAAMALLLVIIGVAAESSESGDKYGNRPLRPRDSGIPMKYWPMYTTAAEEYRVNPYVLASIHKQETEFSRNPAAESGANSSGAMGPMQFLEGTWQGHKNAFRPIKDDRPESYRLQRDKLPSCEGVPDDTGCVYDDFDAIAGAAHKMHADGADRNVNSKGTRDAVCAYIGDCDEVNKCTGSINEYCQVLPRAREWELKGGTGGPTRGADGAVTWALKQNGTLEKPMGSDCGGPIGDWQRRAGSSCGVAWCGVFVHEAFLQAGIDLPDFVIGVPETLRQAKAGHKALKYIPEKEIERGDLVIFNWDGGVVDHVGLATGSYKNGRLKTIEGNTSDAVHKRTEYAGQIVAGVRVTMGAK